MKNLSIKHKAYVIYFILAWPLLTINDDAPLWVIALVVLNLANAARLIKQVPIQETN